MKRKLFLLLVLTLLCTLFVMPVSAAEAESHTEDQVVVAATSGSNYFTKSFNTVNSINGNAAVKQFSSGSCSGNTRSITKVSVTCRVSNGSSRYYLTVVAPSGNSSTIVAGTNNTTYTFTAFNGEDPKGDWYIIVESLGAVTTISGSMKVEYNYSY